MWADCEVLRALGKRADVRTRGCSLVVADLVVAYLIVVCSPLERGDDLDLGRFVTSTLYAERTSFVSDAEVSAPGCRRAYVV